MKNLEAPGNYSYDLWTSPPRRQKKKSVSTNVSAAFFTVMPKGLTTCPKSMVDGKWPNKEAQIPR
jgi:hypothetical protein